MRFLTTSKTDEALLLLRIMFGLMMMVHGWSKFSKFSDLSSVFPDPFGMGSTMSLSMAIFAELGCSLLLIAGLGTRFVLIPLIVTMLVAIFIAHGADPWSKKELAATYLSVYAALLVCGPGRYSVDHLIANRK